MLLVTLFMERRKKQNPSESPSVEEWLNKHECISFMAYLQIDERVKDVHLVLWKISKTE